MCESSGELLVNVELGARSYEIAIVSHQAEAFPARLETWLKRLTYRTFGVGSALIVTDKNVLEPHGRVIASGLEKAGWRTEVCVLEPGEQAKSLETVAKVYDQLVQMQADRHTIVVAVGGGVVGDAGGFVAATYTRGIPYVQVPTSLLAQVDSSVGGKVAVNHPKAKNLIGAFYQPLGVFIDTAMLDTLPEREYLSGLGEVIKYGVILDAEFFEYLESHVEDINQRSSDALRHLVARSCQLKADVVEKDEFERTGLRAILNYGHTFAHAFEVLSGYGELLHGEAVAIGMVYASRLAERLELIDPSVTERQRTLLQAVGLPVSLADPQRFSTDDILARMHLDKKTVSGQLRFVLPTELGHVDVFKNIAEDIVRTVLEETAVL